MDIFQGLPSNSVPLCLTSWEKSKEISQDLRKNNGDLHKAGSSLGDISKCLNVPRSSVRKYKHHGTTQLSYRSGRSRILSPRDERTLVQHRHKKAKQRFATAHGDKDRTFWRNVLWANETKIELFGRNDHCYIWMEKGEACKPNNTIPTLKHGGGSIMLWG